MQVRYLRLLVSFLFFIHLSIAAQQRLALVIGNGDYSASPLKNPLNDAKAMATRLRASGFEVIEKVNLNRTQMRQAFRDYGDKLKKVDVGLFYYAGHGAQVEGVNYLIPLGANIAREDEISDQGLSLNALLQKIKSASNALNMVVLDACRDNPFGSALTRGSASRGLARVNAPGGTIVIYAAAPGQTSSDGDGENGLFTSHFLAQMQVPGLELGHILRNTGRAVYAQSKQKQEPHVERSLLAGEFYFIQADNASTNPVQNMNHLSPQELSRWQDVRQCTSLAQIKQFVADFPKGTFTPVARNCLNQLQAEQQANQKLALYIDTLPINATVRILNTVARYQYGSKLAPDRYQIEVSQKGYKTKTDWLTLGPKSQDFYFKLDKQVIPTRQSQSYRVAGLSFTMKAIPAGTFQMGCVSGKSCRNDEKPVHQVKLKAFSMMETEVTFALWSACVNAGACGHSPNDLDWGKGSRPVINVSWNDITQNFILWLNRQTGQNFNLPSEAQWEYAARAGSRTKYSWGDKIDCSQAQYGGGKESNCYDKLNDQYRGTAEVKSFSPNKWGLYDMHGNVWEWIQDCSDNGEAWSQGECGRRVLRGGSWLSQPNVLRSAYRSNNTPTGRGVSLGFRLVQGL